MIQGIMAASERAVTTLKGTCSGCGRRSVRAVIDPDPVVEPPVAPALKALRRNHEPGKS